MKRKLEPELMEEYEQAKAYAEADFSNAHNNYIILLKEQFKNLDFNGYALDLGCGPGDISFRFARAFHNCKVHGVDGSDAMLKFGQCLLYKATDIKFRVKFINALLPGAILPRKKYDFIICNSLLHHFHNPANLWSAVNQYAAPNAPIFIMDLKRAETSEEAESLVETYASTEPEILKHDFYHSLFAAFEKSEIEEQLKTAGLEQLTVNEVSDRHVVISGYMK